MNSEEEKEKRQAMRLLYIIGALLAVLGYLVGQYMAENL